MLCAIWYHLYNLQIMKNTHGGVLLLVKLQALAGILTVFFLQMVPNRATYHILTPLVL